MRRVICAAFSLALVLPATAAADGLPVTGIEVGPSGVTTETSAVRYVTLRAGDGTTLLARVRRSGGQVLRSRLLRGSFTVPAVALDGTSSGLSADGSTLVLIRPRAKFPQRRTRLAVIDARRLRLRSVVTLRGDFSFDALSPDGRTMYLIEYTSRRDPTRYAVRAYDLAERRLRRAPVVDPREPDERMRGMPITRATSRDGRWEYTLYDGAGSYPFVHALDTVRSEALCIDLDALTGHMRLYELRLRLVPGELRVMDGRQPVALVHRETHAVSEPRAAARRPRPLEDGGPPLMALAAAAAALFAAAVAVRRKRPRRTGERGSELVDVNAVRAEGVGEAVPGCRQRAALVPDGDGRRHVRAEHLDRGVGDRGGGVVQGDEVGG